jgi:lysine biosynthesis protein LysW
MTATAICPSCGEDIRLPHSSNVRIGQRLLCPHCDAGLEVIELDPVELDWADWDEEWDEDSGEEDLYR